LSLKEQQINGRPRISKLMYSLLALLNLLTPKQWSSRRVARDFPYGPHRKQTLDIYAPRDGAGPFPVIFFVYGGSWTMGDRRFYEFAGRALAAAGYVVVIADYRLVPEVEYPTFLEDCGLGFAWTAEHIGQYRGDAARIVLMGHSAGAYNAVMLMLAPGFLAPHAASRVKAFVGLSGPYDFYPFDVPVSLRAFGAVSDLRSTQPINLTRPGLPPALLMHGDADTLVQPRNTVVLAARLRDAGTTVVETRYPRLGHGGTLLALGFYGRRKAPVLSDVVAFLRAHV
jgi:acetyl esterase/lipase